MNPKPYNLSRLKALRRAAGLKQHELAELAGIKIFVIQKHERGAVHDAKLSLAVPLARALGVATDELFTVPPSDETLERPTPKPVKPDVLTPIAQLLRELVPLLSAAGHVKAARAASIQAALLSSE